ncbi:MAG: dUTP diphosphatase [Oscillospiraceae bacterium]
MTDYTNSNILKFVKLEEGAVIPARATAGSAGYDLSACMETPVTLAPGERAVFPTGLGVGLPENTAGLIFTRSGLGVKHGIHVTNGVGVIDWDYRGEIRVSLHNLSGEAYTVEPCERIAQLLLVPVSVPPVEQVDSLLETDRGAGGFGSTGK